jgi:hypothetical protein
MSEREVAAYVCEHVFEHVRPILLVARDGGDWQFLCGGSHDPNEVPRVVGMNHLTEEDPSLRQILDLSVNWEAERLSLNDPWIRTACQQDQ